MLAKILSQRHGFKCTVLFSLDPDGTINPKNGSRLQTSPPSIRRRHRDARCGSGTGRTKTWRGSKSCSNAGKPIVALRTSTHAFNGFPKGSRWESWNYNNQGGFGKRVLGETWLTHWGKHKIEGDARCDRALAAGSNPLLRGVSSNLGETDVYEAYPPADATILVRGIVLKTLTPDSEPADYASRARPTRSSKA